MSCKQDKIQALEQEIQLDEIKLTPIEYQKAIELVADLAYDLFQLETKGLERTEDINRVFQELFMVKDNNALQDQIIDNLSNLFESSPNQINQEPKFIKLLELMGLDLETDKFTDPTQNEFLRKVLFEFNNRDYTLNVNKEYNDAEDREAWQIEVVEVNQYDKLSQKLKLKLGAIIQKEYVNGQLVNKKGFLNNDVRYPIGYVYGKLIGLLGNSPDSELYEYKVYNNIEDPIMQQVFDQNSPDYDQIYAEIYRHIGQNIHYKYIDTRHYKKEQLDELGNPIIDQEGNPIQITVSESGNPNSINDKSVVKKQLRTNILIKDKGLDKSYTKLAKDLDDKNPQTLIKTMKSYGLLPDNFNSLNDQVIKIADQLIRDINQGKDVFGLTKDVPEGKGYTQLVNYIVSNSTQALAYRHLNADGKQVYEFNKPNYLTRILNVIGSISDRFQHLLDDPYLNKLPLLEQMRKNQVKPVILNSVLEVGKTKATEYKNMSKRQLLLQSLSAFATSQPGKVIITNPTHSDAGIQTGLEIDVVNLQGNSGSANKGRLDPKELFASLTHLAKQERRMVEARKANPLQAKENGHVIFNFLDGKPEHEFYALIVKNMQNYYSNYYNDLVKAGLVKESYNKEGKLIKRSFENGIFSGNTVEGLTQQFYLHQFYYNAQATLLLEGDPSYYGNIDYSKDEGKGNNGIPSFFKRAKQIWSPVSFTLVGAKWKGTDLKGNPVEYEVPEEFNLQILEEIETGNQEFIDWLAMYYPEYKDKFSKVSLTDAQSYIDPIRYMIQSIGLAEFDQQQFDDLQRVLKGETNFESNTLFGPQKPFYFNFHQTIDENGDTIATPFQNKDSEAILLPVFGLEIVGGKPNPMFNPKYKWMLEKMGYSFTESEVSLPSIKDRLVTGNNYIDKFTFDSAVKVGATDSNTLNTENIESSTTPTRMSNHAYGKQMEVPNHILDDEQKMAVQVRKNMIKDIKKDQLYVAPDWHEGDTITGEQLIKEFNRLEIDNLTKDMERVSKKFDTLEGVISMLQTEIFKRGMDSRFIELTQMIDGEPNLPLDHPAFIYQVRQVMNAVFSKRVIDQKLTNGVAYANMSGWGFEQPKVVTKEDGSIDYYEAFAPVHNSTLKRFMRPNEILDYPTLLERAMEAGMEEKEVEKMVKGIIWRIPNEKVFSNFHIKVTKFFPAEMGGSVVLPLEMTKLSGADFDIDKMYGFYYNFKEVYGKADINTLLLNASSKELDMIASFDSTKSEAQIIRDALASESIIETVNGEEIDQNEYTDLKKWLLKRMYKLGKENKVKPKIVFPTKGKEGNHNKMMDLMQSIMSHPDTAKQILKTSDFDIIKEIRDDLKKNKPLNPFLADTLATIGERMLTGKQLIGPLANINSILALLQQSEMQFNYPIKFGNKTYTKLNQIEVNGVQPSDTIGNWVAAIVDNGKDPLAGDLNVNWGTIDAMIALYSVGLPHQDVLGFLNEPIVAEYGTLYTRYGANVQAHKKAVLELLNRGKAKDDRVGLPDTEKLMLFDLPYTSSMNQQDVFMSFLKYRELGNDLRKVVTALKIAEGGLGSSAGHTLSKLEQVRDGEQVVSIKGAFDFINNKDYVHAKMIDVLKEATKVITQGEAQMADLDAGAYKQVLDRFRTLKDGFSLTKDEIDDISHQFRMYAMSSMLPYNTTRFNSFPPKFMKFLSTHPDYQEISQHFSINSDNMLVYKGISGDLGKAAEKVRKVIEAMVNDSDSEVQDIIKGLGTYTFYLDGFGVSPHGFSHLLPISWYKKFANFSTASLNQEITEPMVIDQFVRQYIRNNFRNLSYVETYIKGTKMKKGKYYKTTQGILMDTKSKNIAPLGKYKKGSYNEFGGLMTKVYSYANPLFFNQSLVYGSGITKEQVKDIIEMEKDTSVSLEQVLNKLNQYKAENKSEECKK